MGARQVDEETIRRWIAEGVGTPGGSSYLVYNFGLSQASSLVNPTATIRANTFTGGTTWEREDVGVYFTITDLDYPSPASKIYIVGQYSADAYLPFYSGGGNLQGWARVETSNASGKLRIYVYIEDLSDTAADLSDVFGGGNLVNFAEVQVHP